MANPWPLTVFSTWKIKVGSMHSEKAQMRSIFDHEDTIPVDTIKVFFVSHKKHDSSSNKS
jgi:hypothetical protein